MRFVCRTASLIIPTLVVLLALIFVQFASITALANRSMVLSSNNLGVSNHLTNNRKSTFPITTSLCNPCGTGDLSYQKGSAVELRPKAYAIFWGSYWKNKSGNLKNDGQIVQKYFTDVGGTQFENILTQYYMQTKNGTQSYIQNTLQFNASQIWIDTSTPPNSKACSSQTIEDSAIQTEVENAINQRGWPQADPSATFFVYTPPNWTVHFQPVIKFLESGCSNGVIGAFCGYHWMNPVTLTRYATNVYPDSSCLVPSNPPPPNGNIYGDSLANITSHEQFEAITDPRPYASANQLHLDGWADNSGYEIGDKCAYNYQSGFTHLHNGGVFELQEEYSDATHSCVNNFTPHLTVNTTSDLAPPCDIAKYSLRCAIMQANTVGSGVKIWFNIPTTDSGCKLTILNVYTCAIDPTSDLPALTASNTTINGYSQPGAQLNTLAIGSGDNAILTILLDGSSGAGGLTLTGNASHDIINGLQITHFTYGILLYPNTVTNNSIIGNFIGTNGIEALGNGEGIYIGSGAQNNVVGGITPATANLISGNTDDGILIGLGTGNIVEGNYIGTDTSGHAAIKKSKGTLVRTPLSAIPNSTGVTVFAQANNNTIGGTNSASANIIADNTYGIVTDNSNNTSITENNINSNFTGVYVEDGETGDNISQNTISSNSDAGILVGNSSTDNVHVAITHNSIFNNGGLGIDLYPADTVNCNTSTSGGPNDYLPCPVITSATTTHVSGTAFPNSIVEIYSASNETDDQGHGEGFGFLGTVTADSSGNWSISLTLPAGEEITATATYFAIDANYTDTSEYAANVAVS